MTKSELREVSKARNLAKAGHLNMAANTLSIIHRSAMNSRSKREIREVIQTESLSGFLIEQNGTFWLRTND